MISQERTIGQDWLYRKKKMMMMTELVGEAFLSGREMGGFILGPAPIHAMGSLQCDDADMTALAHKPSRQSAPRKLATPTLLQMIVAGRAKSVECNYRRRSARDRAHSPIEGSHYRDQRRADLARKPDDSTRS